MTVALAHKSPAVLSIFLSDRGEGGRGNDQRASAIKNSLSGADGIPQAFVIYYTRMHFIRLLTFPRYVPGKCNRLSGIEMENFTK